MATRPITICRLVYFNFLEQENFSIDQWIKNQGWKRFCSLDLPVYPNLVRAFFENIRLESSQIFSTVKGVDLVVDEARLCKLLGMPNQDLYHLHLNKKKEGLQVILKRRNINFKGNLIANQLSPEMRFLHNMVSRIFFPKTGSLIG